MGTCKCNQVSSVVRSDLYITNIDIEPKQAGRKKLMRLQTLNNFPFSNNPIILLKSSAEKFIRERASFFKTVISKDGVFNNADLQKQLNTNLNNNNINNNNLNTNSSTHKTILGNLLDKDKTIQCDFTEKNCSSQESQMTANILLRHFFFYKATSDIMNYILDEITEFSINANASLFNENDEGSCMFIIKTGQVELSHSDNQCTKIMTNDEIFGELAILKKNSKREYTAKTLTELDCYMIEGNAFSSVAEQLMGRRKYHFPFLNYIDSTYKDNLELFIIELDLKKGHCINNIKEIFGVVEGRLRVIDKKNNGMTIINPHEFYGLSPLLLDNESKENEMKIVIEESSKCFVLPYKAFIEVFGLNYQYELLYSYFKCSISNNTFFSLLCNDANFPSLFNLFKIVQYSNEQIVYSSSIEPKVIILLDGDLIFLNSKVKTIFFGQVFGEEIVNEGEYVDDIISKHQSLVFECNWELFCTKATINSIPYNELIPTLKRMYLLNSFEEKQLIKIGAHINKVSYIKGEVIIKANQEHKRFYLIQKGIVKQMQNNKIIRYYHSNNTFGEIYLLNEDKEDNTEVIAKSKTVSLLYLSKEIFFNLLGNDYINEYIKVKISNENTEVFLRDLYTISTLHKGKQSNVYLVHNILSLYSIKSIRLSDKDKQIIPSIINEKNVSVKLDHPFVIQYAKTLKAHNWCLFLQEYAYGITIQEYLEMNFPFYDNNLIQFYGGSLLMILEYLKSIGVVHRDIMLNNIIIDTSGYIKLLDFSSSKIIKRNYTKTIIGTPLYIAPEVLKGKGYSYSCDYWSVGICLYYIYYGYYPFGEKAVVPGDVYKEILNK